MQKYFYAFVVLCLLPISLNAQWTLVHPEDAGAVLLAIDTVAYFIPGIDDPPVLSATKHGETRHVIAVWRTGSGRTDYVTDPETFSAGDSADIIEQLTTQQLFDKITYASVRHGITMSHADTSHDSAAPMTSRFYTRACVVRYGYASTTTFDNCTGDWISRNVSYYQESTGDFNITLAPALTEVSCSNNCETTISKEPTSRLY